MIVRQMWIMWKMWVTCGYVDIKYGYVDSMWTVWIC